MGFSQPHTGAPEWLVEHLALQTGTSFTFPHINQVSTLRLDGCVCQQQWCEAVLSMKMVAALTKCLPEQPEQ